MALSLRCRCTFSEFIGLTPSSSLNTLGKVVRICPLTEVSTLATVGHGNEAGIMASLIMSCHDSNTGWVMSVATSTVEGTVHVDVENITLAEPKTVIFPPFALNSGMLWFLISLKLNCL